MKEENWIDIKLPKPIEMLEFKDILLKGMGKNFDKKIKNHTLKTSKK